MSWCSGCLLLHSQLYTRKKSTITFGDRKDIEFLANVPIHVERVIGAVQQKFSIMSATGVLPKQLFQQKGEGDTIILDSIMTVCCGINNLCEGIVPFE